VVVPTLLDGKFLRSPWGRDRIKNGDICRTKTLPGVVDAVTREDPEIKAMPQIPVP
jgi:hypothetical protein